MTPIAELATKHEIGSVPLTVGVTDTVCAPLIAWPVPVETDEPDPANGVVEFTPEYSRTLALIQSAADAENVNEVGDDDGAYR